MAATRLDLGMRCIKYLLCVVNFIFVLTGVMVIIIGTTIFAVYGDYSHFLDSSYFWPATLLIVVGALIFIIAFCGCCGAIKESTCMVLVFAVSLSVVLILEFSAATAAYALQNDMASLIKDKIQFTMQYYEQNSEAKSEIDFLQSQLECCGNDGPNDWSDILTNSTNNFGVPSSCCNWIAGRGDCKSIYTHGCYRALSLVVNQCALYLITGAMMIVLIQMTGIMFACTLGKAIRREKTKRDMH